MKKQINMTYLTQRVVGILKEKQEAWIKSYAVPRMDAIQKEMAANQAAATERLPDSLLIQVGVEALLSGVNMGYTFSARKKAQALLDKAVKVVNINLQREHDRLSMCANYRRFRGEKPDDLQGAFLAKKNEIMDAIMLGGTPAEEVLAQLVKWKPEVK